MRVAVGELESQLRHATNLLAEFKHRAYMAEARLSPFLPTQWTNVRITSSRSNSRRLQPMLSILLL